MSAPDAEARRRIREDLDATFVVEAAAGTGKTTVLVDRVVALVRSGRGRLAQIIAVTFTEKAAGEMKLRLRAALEDARLHAATTERERAHLDASLEELEAARIGTIHSLCADLLRERPVEAGVDPLFQVAAQDEADTLLEQAFNTWFEETLRDPPEGTRRLLRRRPMRRDGPTPRKLLRDAALKLVERRDFDAPWRREPHFHREEEIDAAVEQLRDLGALAAKSRRPGKLKDALAEVQRFIEDLDHRERVAERDPDGLEASLRDLSRARWWRWSGYGDDFAEGLPRAKVLERRDEAKAMLDRLVERCDADVASRLREELWPGVRRYESQKSAAGRLDFTDLLIKTRDLVRDQPPVREALQKRFTHLFVDEFQDTDPLQAELLLLLSADDPAVSAMDQVRPVPGKLFIVGDPKQSIYSFRRADVALYQRIKAQLQENGAELLYLSKSFRALRPIQDLVNAAFAPAMGEGSPTQARYVPLETGRAGAESGRQPPIIVLPVPRPYGDYGTVVDFKIEESFPDAAASFVEWLVQKSGWTVMEDGARVPVAPRHICILFRRFQSYGDDLTKGYATALEVRRIPHVLVGGRSFHAREEVLALRNALTAVEWPDDELSVFATLRGPLFALSDDQLLGFRGLVGRMHPLRPKVEQELPPAVAEVHRALEVLKELHYKRNRRPIPETLSRLLGATRAHAGLAFWSGGEQALANVLHLSELARRFEARGATSFRGFVEQLWDEAEGGEADEARVVEEGTEGVRLMTVHRAKGLEFPVVLLADPTARAVSAQPSRHVDTGKRLWAEPLAGCVPWDLLDHRAEATERDREEAHRLAYVAATRARDLLVIPGVGDGPRPGWLEVLNPAITPRMGTQRQPSAAPGCPPFGKETVLDRPEESQGRFNFETVVSPGLHVTEVVGSPPVTWWDPAALALLKETDATLRREEILVEDKGGDVARASAEAYAAWERTRAERIAAASKPALEAAPVRAAAADDTRPPPQIFPVEIGDARRAGRPGGKRFGALVHGVLSRAPLDAGAAALQPLIRYYARLFGCPEEERRAAEAAVLSALRHPLLARARAAAEVRREDSIALRTAPGMMVEGNIDMAFRDARGWTVVELKTDQIETLPAAYHRQLGLYVDAISQATGTKADGVILLV